MTSNTKIYKISRNPEITENELKFDNTYLDFEYENNTSMREDLNILQYDEYDTILPLSWSKPKFSKFLVKSKNVLRYQHLTYSDVTVITFLVPKQMIHYVHSPVSLFAGLSQVGGLLAVFKLSLVLLCYVNRHIFKKRVLRFIKGKNSQEV